MVTDDHRPKVLIIDNKEEILAKVQPGLSEDYAIFQAHNGTAAIDISLKEDISIVLLDLELDSPSANNGNTGLCTLEQIIQRNPLAKVIATYGISERQNVIRALEKGAFDVFALPINLDELKIVLHRACHRLEIEQEALQVHCPENRLPFQRMIGSSAVMKAVFSTIDKIAETDVPVFILGESGTGKELVANAIHSKSTRRNGPFVPINCGAIPEALLESELFGNEKGAFTGAVAHRRGKIDYAQGGTLFLDEIGDLAPTLQVKILRFLQEKIIERVGGREAIPVDCRVIAATHRNMAEAIQETRFRPDLYFRLAVVKIVLPPLRQREDDVVQIAHHLLQSFSMELKKPIKKLSIDAIEAIRRHSWPGNVRELQNRIKRALVLADGSFIGPADLELEPSSGPFSGWTLRQATEELQREIVTKKLHDSNGNISRAARALGISRPTLYDLMSRHGLDYRTI